MLKLTARDLEIIRHWSEKAETSPFPQEQSLLLRISRNSANRDMLFSHKELRIILHWAEQELTGHFGTEQYIFEKEQILLKKIENYLEDEY